jgi:iron complex outermembrane recepter protein
MNTSTRRRLAAGTLAVGLASLAPQPLWAQAIPPPSSPVRAAVDDPIMLSPFEVSTTSDVGYVASTSLSGTRVATEIANLPMTVNVLTKEFLDDIGVQDLQDAVRYTAGAYQSESIIGDQNAFQIRGLRQDYSLRNGFRSASQPTFFGIARVEVVKGPASVLYGQAYPGGVLNFITPKPQAQRRTELSASVSSEGAYRGVIDTTGAITADGSLQYRFIGGYRYFDYVARYAEFSEYGANLQLRWRPLAWLQLDGEIERFKRDEIPVGGQVVYNQANFNAALAGTLTTGLQANPVSYTGYAPFMPRDWNNMGPDHYRDRKVDVITLGAEIKLPGTWRFRSTNNWLDEHTEQNIRYFNTSRVSGIHIPVRDNQRYLDRDNWYTQNDLTGVFELGATRHNVLVGYEAYDTEYYQSPEYRSAVVNGRITDLFPQIPSVANQRAPYPFGILETLATSPTQLNGGSIFTGDSGTLRVQGWGVYATDQVSLLDERLFIMGAGRHEAYKVGVTGNLKEDALTGQVGLLYKAYRNPDTGDVVSPFFSLSQSFRPNTAFDPVTRDPFPPELGKSWEVGLKTQLLDNRLNLFMSYFDITRERVQATIAIRNESGDVTGYRAAINGREISTGFEVEGVYSPVPNYQIVFSYAQIDSYIDEPGEALTAAGVLPGQDLGTPDETASMWHRYRFESGPARGLSLGLGVSYVGGRLAGNYNNQTVLGAGRWVFRNESYTRWDALIGYGWRTDGRSYNLSLNIQNLSDELYYLGTSTRSSEPRTYLATLRVVF